jgi:radical SAM protein
MRPGDVDTSERPFVLVWELTQACELACEHCRADAQEQRHPDELTTREGKALLSEASEFGDDQLVVLSGGDPMARPDTVELVEHGVSEGLQVTLTPSGTSSLTDDAVADLADAGLRRMALSIDGASAAAHDGFRGEDGSFEETLRAARAARDAGLPLQVNTTVCARTVDDLPMIRDLVADLDAVLWSVFFLVPVGRGEVLDPVPPRKAEQVMEWLVDVKRGADIAVKTTEAPHFRRVAAQRARAEAAADGGRPSGGDDGPSSVSGGGRGSGSGGRGAGIYAGDGFAFVSHVGEVYPSGFLPEAAGNVREEGIRDLYRNADLFERLRDRDALEGKCGACPFRFACGGSRSRAYATTGNPMAADPLCPYVPEGYDGPLPDRLETA